VRLSHTPKGRRRGFSLIELMVTIAFLAILTTLAAPSFGAYLRNNQVRAASDALQNGLRTAQAEAVRSPTQPRAPARRPQRTAATGRSRRCRW
jgi:prepilin-type N-terminal cleavage/methylation domain-containing protein